MAPYEIKQQLEALATSVERYEPSQVVSSAVGNQANALLNELASALPSNAVIAATPEFVVGSGKYIAGMRAADVATMLRALANQITKAELDRLG